MTTTSSSLDSESLVARIIAELQANPDAQPLLLRALLTNEFLGMPIRLERIEADVAELKIRMTSVEIDLAVLKGNMLEVKLHRRIRPLLSQRLDLRRAQVLQSPVQDTHPELFQPVEEAFDGGALTMGRKLALTLPTSSSGRCARRTVRQCGWPSRCPTPSANATWSGHGRRPMP